MSQAQVQLDLTTWVIEVVFYAAAVFSIIYGFTYTWWETWTGWSVVTIHIGILFALLRSMLFIWGIQVVHLARGGQSVPTLFGTIMTWISVGGLALTAISIIILIVMSILHIRSDPEPPGISRLAYKILRTGKHDPHARGGAARP